MVQLIAGSSVKSISSWGYRLQGNADTGGVLTPADLMTAQHDLLVIDFSSDGRDNGRYLGEDIARLKQRSDDAVVLGYVSIGGVADYRSIWDKGWTSDGRAAGEAMADAPAWLGPYDPAWPDGRRVRFSDPDWQAQIFNRYRCGWVDLIAAQGFDGALVDVSECLGGAAAAGDAADARLAARAAIDVILSMTRHVRQTHPEFAIVPLDGDLLLDNLSRGSGEADAGDQDRMESFEEIVTAIVAEGVYCPGTQRENNPLAPDESRISTLAAKFLANGKPVLSLEYLNDAGQVGSYLTRCAQDGFVPYAAPSRNLDQWGPAYSDGNIALVGATSSTTRSMSPPGERPGWKPKQPTQKLKWGTGPAHAG